LRAYAVDILPPGSRSRFGTGVYLGKGLVITAAHVVPAKPSVRIAGVDLPATIIKQGAFAQVDLALLHVDQERLPADVRLLRVALCQYTPWAGDPVIVAIPESTARSQIMLSRLLPPAYRSKFPAVIPDVATTGDSGSGVFDARSKCLLGIMSGKIVVRMDGDGPGSEAKDLAKYFVPVWTISEFIPAEYRSW
jgi:trypsin-like peptidase